MEHKEKRIIITGGNGFIGSHLSNKLTKEKNIDEVHIIDLLDSSEVNPILLKRNNLYFHNVNILDLNSLCQIVKQINPTHVFHLAAILNRSRDFSALETSISVNILGTCNLLHALRDIQLSRFLHMNTSECYGHNSPPFTENMRLSPCSPYSSSKSSSELFTMVFSEMYSIPTTYIRSFNVFGEGESEDMLIPQVIISGLKKKDIDLTKGEQTRDSIYIKDIIEGICLAIFSEKSVGETNRTGEINYSHHNHQFKSLALKSCKKLDRHTFELWYEALPPSVIRGKGILFFADEPGNSWVWQKVGKKSSIKKFSRNSSYSDLVLIGTPEMPSFQELGLPDGLKVITKNV